MAAFSHYKLAFALLSMFIFADNEARPRRSLEDLERLKMLDEIRDLSSVITLIDIPEDNTPKGPEDEDDNGSGTENTENAQCRGLFNNIQEVNASANGTKDAPDLIHANYDTLCDKTDNDKIKKLPVYIVGWELKEHCGDVNTIPFKRFRLDEYHAKKPRFDIPGMCIPMKGKEMTLLMVDPDAPSKDSHRCRSWLHWLVVNIPKGNVPQGKEIIAYKPPAPPLHSGPHRYFFLLYEQNHHIKDIDDSDNNMAERCGFNVRTFAEDNSLVGPIALNMFLTERKRISQDYDGENKKDKEKREKEKKEKEEKEQKDKEDKEKKEQKDKEKKEQKGNENKDQKDGGEQKKTEKNNGKEEQKNKDDEKRVEQKDNVDVNSKEQQNMKEQTKGKEKQETTGNKRKEEHLEGGDTKDNEESVNKEQKDNKQKEGERKNNVNSNKEGHKDAQNMNKEENDKGAQRDKIDVTTKVEQQNSTVTREREIKFQQDFSYSPLDAKGNETQNNTVQQRNETMSPVTQEQKSSGVQIAKIDAINNGNQTNKVELNNKNTGISGKSKR